MIKKNLAGVVALALLAGPVLADEAGCRERQYNSNREAGHSHNESVDRARDVCDNRGCDKGGASDKGGGKDKGGGDRGGGRDKGGGGDKGGKK